MENLTKKEWNKLLNSPKLLEKVPDSIIMKYMNKYGAKGGSWGPHPDYSKKKSPKKSKKTMKAYQGGMPKRKATHIDWRKGGLFKR